MSKYYRAENAGRGIVAGVSFNVIDVIAGTPVGVYEATKPQEIAGLDAAVAAGRITSISHEDFEAYLKKKAPGYDNFQFSTPQLPSKASIKGQGVKVVIESPEEPEAPVEIKTTLDKADDALQLGPVRAPEVEDQPAPPVPAVEKKAPKSIKRQTKEAK